MTRAFDWAAQSGDHWAARWRDTDRALSSLAERLDPAIAAAAPAGPFRALDVGCGPGSTSLALAAARPDAAILASDLSPPLVEIARQRLGASAQVVLGDARAVARSSGPFDLIFSRHGVMFFDDPVAAFADLHRSAAPGGRLVFSCFQAWEANSWASELAQAVAGGPLPPKGREPGPFAFADPEYVRDLLRAARWRDVQADALPFVYVAGEGAGAVDEALAFFGVIGPAAALLRELPEGEREAAVERLRAAIDARFDGAQVRFDAAAWIWSASAGAA